MCWDEIEAKLAGTSRQVQAGSVSAVGPEEDPPIIPPGDLPEPPLPECEFARSR